MKTKGMDKPKRISWINGLAFTLFFMGVPSLVYADINYILSKCHPYVTVEEEYNSNIFLSNNKNKIDDFITTASVGLRFSALEERRYGVDFDFRAGGVFYAKEHQFSYFDPSGSLNAWYAATPRLTFRVRDYLIRSDAARESVYTANAPPNQFLLSTTRGEQAIYLRNVVEPALEYRFGQENLLSVLYRNNVYNNQNPQFEDSMENTINPKLTYWFDIRNGVSLDYYFTYNSYQLSPDQFINAVTPRYTHRFNPRTSIFGEFHFEWQNFKSPGIDYYVYNPSLGMEYRFSPTLIGTAQAGYFWQTPEEGSRTSAPSLNLSLTKSEERTTYSLSFQGGYTEDYITAENRGFSKYYRMYGTITHRLTEKLTVGVTGSMERATFSNDQKDWIWGISGNASYALLRWLSLSLQVEHHGDNSNISDLDYAQYRGIFRITATY